MPHSQVIPGETSVIILDRNGRVECTGTGAQRLLGPILGDCRHAADLLHACAPHPDGPTGALARWEDLSALRPGEPAASLPGRVDNNGTTTDILLRFLPLDNKVIVTIGPLPHPPESSHLMAGQSSPPTPRITRERSCRCACRPTPP